MIDIFSLYEDLKKYTLDRDDMFYDAPEGEVQFDILREMLMDIYSDL